MFKPGDRLKYIGKNQYFLRYKEAVAYEHPMSRDDTLKWVKVRFDGCDYRLHEYPNNGHTMAVAEFELLTPLSPFEADVQAYIRSELNVQV